MNGANFTLDMTMMFAVHDALRRDLGRIARVAGSTGDDPRRVLSTAVGWEMFKSFLRVHHTAEDASVWAVMRQALAGRPGDLALLDAMEDEHASIDPLLVAVDAVLADRNAAPGTLGDVTDALAAGLSAHLRHEESEALRLIDATLTREQWKHFSDDHRARIGADAARYLPWLLDEASPETVEAILGRMPDQLRRAYADEWRTAYLDLRPWRARHEPADA